MPKPFTAALLRPDLDPASTVTTTDQGWLHGAWNTAVGIANSDWFMWAVCGLLALLLALNIRTRRKRARAEKAGRKADLTFADRAVTIATGILATATVATGAWKVFGLPALDLHPAFRVMLFFFAEAQIVNAWRRVRRHIYRHAALGKGIRTIFGVALGSALVAAFDADVFVEVLLRFFAAFVAAYMIAEELAEELDIHLTRNPGLRKGGDLPLQRGRIKWALNWERVLVWLRLAEATNRTIADVERQRRVAQLSRISYRLQLLKDRDQTWLVKARIAWTRWRLRRLTEAANEHLKLATNKALLAELRAQAALLYGAEDGMSRSAVRDLHPWAPAVQLAIAATPFTPPMTAGHGDPRLAMDIATRSQTTVANTDATELATAPAVEVANDDATVAASQVATDDANQPATPDATTVATECATEVADQAATDHATTNATQPATDGATKTAKRVATRRAKTVANERAKDTVIRLAKFLAKYPDETNGELAKRMHCGDRTVSRYRADAEAYNLANERPETRPEHPLVATPMTPIPEPRQGAKSGVNGHHVTKEN